LKGNKHVYSIYFENLKWGDTVLFWASVAGYIVVLLYINGRMVLSYSG